MTLMTAELVEVVEMETVVNIPTRITNHNDDAKPNSEPLALLVVVVVVVVVVVLALAHAAPSWFEAKRETDAKHPAIL